MKICSCRKNGGLLVVYSRCVYSDILNRKFLSLVVGVAFAVLRDVPSARFLVDDSSPSLFTLNLKSAFSRGLSFRKLQIFISQTTDSHFANYRFSFRKLQIFISQTTDFHFVSFHFVSFHFVSQTTVSR